jgi:tryptophanyl-tRNA synthetase
MSLQDPAKKMSKSDTDLQNIITLLDSPEQIRKKLKRAVTDSGKEIKFDPIKHPGVSNLLNIYSGLSEMEISKVESHFSGKLYSNLKDELIDLIIEVLRPIHDEYNRIIEDKGFLKSVLDSGQKKAGRLAYKTLRKVYKKIGFIPKSS